MTFKELKDLSDFYKRGFFDEYKFQAMKVIDYFEEETIEFKIISFGYIVDTTCTCPTLLAGHHEGCHYPGRNK
jgi:hypothetical protein